MGERGRGDEGETNWRFWIRMKERTIVGGIEVVAGEWWVVGGLYCGW